MPPESKKPSVLSRVFSRSSKRSSRPAGANVCDQLEDSSTIAAGPSSSHHPSTHSVPELSLPVNSSSYSTPQIHGHESLTQIHQSNIENEIFGSSQTPEPSMHGRHELLRPPQQFLGLQPYDNPTVLGAHGGTTSIFQGANGFQIGNLHVNVNGAGGENIDGWELLLKHTAPDALHNSRARYDAPKCDKDTRVEVTSEIMAFIEDRDGPRRLLCMTGAAGSGKSALQQTTAETCGKKKFLACSFFFSASDLNRNTVDPVIPTIAYQLGRGNPVVKQLIKAAVEGDSLIFSQSLEDQITTLIVEPIEHLSSMGLDLSTLPCAVLIDALDECRGEDCQAELLTAIRKCLLVDSLPFRIFIASRPEWAIRTALEPGGHLSEVTYHIQLSDKYDASADMCRYLWRRFKDIGLRIGDPQWFSEGNIHTLVQAASGQFIYVATVYKYISERRASPAERLKVVLTWTPHKGQVAKPFEVLDILYTNILSAAKHAYEAVDTHHGRDFLLLFRAHQINITGIKYGSTVLRPPADLFSALLGLEARAEESLTSDLRSLVTLERDSTGELRLRMYHKSFSDFMDAESRANDLFVPQSRVYVHLAKCCMQHVTECPLDFDSRA